MIQEKTPAATVCSQHPCFPTAMRDKDSNDCTNLTVSKREFYAENATHFDNMFPKIV